MAYEVLTQDNLALWWMAGTGSVVNRLSEVMDDAPDGPAIYHKDADDDWTSGAGANEWYVATATKPDNVSENLAGWRNMTDAGDDQDGSLNVDEWSYGTGNNRVYIKLSDSSDPNDTDVRAHYAWDGSGAGPAIMTEHVEDRIYQIHLDMTVGDATTSTTLTSPNEMVDMGAKTPQVTDNATLRIGDPSNEYSINGSYWRFTGQNFNRPLSIGSTANWEVYGSILKFDGSGTNYAYWNGGSLVFKNTNIVGYDPTAAYVIFHTSVTDLILYNVYLCNMNKISLRIEPSSCNYLHKEGGASGLVGRIGTFTIENGLATNISLGDFEVHQNGIITLLNPLFNVALPWVSGGGVGYEAYTCDIYVGDKHGDPLASASVDCEYAHLVEGSDSKTYKCIADHTAVDATHKPITGTDWDDYWELYNASGGEGGDWNTSFAYKSATTEFSTQTTAADGTITQQTVNWKYFDGNNRATINTRLHKFTLSKAGYETLVLENITVDGKIDWHVELQPRVKIDLENEDLFIPLTNGENYLLKLN